MKITLTITPNELTLLKDDPVEKFTIPRDFCRTLVKMVPLWFNTADGSGTFTVAELKPTSKAEAQKKKGHGILEKWREVQQVAREVGQNMQGVSKDVVGT